MLPSISETIGGTEEERKMIIALDSLNFVAVYVQSEQHMFLKFEMQCCKYKGSISLSCLLSCFLPSFQIT